MENIFYPMFLFEGFVIQPAECKKNKGNILIYRDLWALKSKMK